MDNTATIEGNYFMEFIKYRRFIIIGPFYGNNLI